MKKLRVRIKKLVSNILPGSSASTKTGVKGSDFYEFKEFDPVSHPVSAIDWKITLKRGKWTVRITEKEKSFTLLFLIDISPSMQIATVGSSKMDLALDFVRAISESALEENAKIGAVLFSNCIKAFIQPSFGAQSIRRIVNTDAVRQQKECNEEGTLLSPVLEFINENKWIDVPSFIVVITDGIFDDSHHCQLARVNRSHDVVVIVVRDRIDNSVPPIKLGYFCARDAESGRLIMGNAIEEDVCFVETCHKTGIMSECFTVGDDKMQNRKKLAGLFARHANER